MTRLTSNNTASTLLPCLTLYIVWASHLEGGKDISEAAALAIRLYEYFCYDAGNPFFGSIGAPVFFRSVPPVGGSDGTPLEIDLDASERSVVIVLSDAKMVNNSATWEPYIDAIDSSVAQSNGRHLIIPLVLSKAGLNLGLCRRINGIRYMNFKEADRWALLKLWLTNEICRHFRTEVEVLQADGSMTKTDRVSPDPLKIFLSHAKADGEEDTIRMLNNLRQAPTSPFFDQVDIAPGYDMGDEIFSRLRESAVIVLLSDAYSDRPWCQKEVLVAKTNRCPMIVVDNLKGKVFRSFPYLGNVITVRKSKGDEAEIIALTLGEALRSMVVSRQMQQLIDTGVHSDSTHILFRPPEVLDGYHLIGKPFAESERPEGPTIVLYPDPPIGPHEIDALGTTLSSHYHFATPLFAGETTTLQNRNIAISISETLDFAALGLASTHVGKIMIEVARYLLANGAKLVYGGDLRAGGFTDILTRLVSTYNATGSVDFKPIINYQPWPFSIDVTEDIIAEMNRIADIRLVPEKSDVSTRFNIDASFKPDLKDTEMQRIVALCLTEMRETMNNASDARILMGGRIAGAAGIGPGVLEEAYLTVRDGKPLYLLGGYGGCTGAICELILGTDSPELKTVLEARDLTVISKYIEETGSDVFRNYDSVKEFFASRGVGGMNTGLEPYENHILFTTLNMNTTIELLLKGLAR